RGLRPGGPTRIERRGHVRLSVQQGPEDGRRPGRVPRPPLRQDAAVDDRRGKADELHAAAEEPRGIHPLHGLALTGGDVGDDRDRLRSALARHLLGSALPFLASFALLRRALHVQTEDPGRPAAHDDFDDRMPARVAPLVRRDDEPALGERIGVVAGRVFRAAHEPLPVRPVADHQFAIAALFAAADEVLLADRWTVGGDAIARRAPAIRVLDHRRAAFGAGLLRASGAARPVAVPSMSASRCAVISGWVIRSAWSSNASMTARPLVVGRGYLPSMNLRS